MQPYQLTIGAGLPQQIRALGNYIRFIEADQSTAIIIARGQVTGAVLRLRPGQGARLPERESLWTFTEVSGIAVTGQITIGDGGFEDDRITGEVSVIDGGMSRTGAGTAFMFYGPCNGGAGVISHSQLWNPASSGKTLVVSRMSVGCNLAGALLFVRHASALTTVNVGGVTRKNPAGAASVAESRRQTNATQLATGDGLMVAYSPAFSMEGVELREPIFIPQGSGIVFSSDNLNVNIQAMAEFIEINA